MWKNIKCPQSKWLVSAFVGLIFIIFPISHSNLDKSSKIVENNKYENSNNIGKVDSSIYVDNFNKNMRSLAMANLDKTIKTMNVTIADSSVSGMTNQEFYQVEKVLQIKFSQAVWSNREFDDAGVPDNIAMANKT